MYVEKEWTFESEQRLIDVIKDELKESYGNKVLENSEWDKVASLMNRAPGECSNKWVRLLTRFATKTHTEEDEDSATFGNIYFLWF
jgi:uncharacterized protein YqgQ